MIIEYDEEARGIMEIDWSNIVEGIWKQFPTALACFWMGLHEGRKENKNQK